MAKRWVLLYSIDHHVRESRHARRHDRRGRHRHRRHDHHGHHGRRHGLLKEKEHMSSTRVRMRACNIQRLWCMHVWCARVVLLMHLIIHFWVDLFHMRVCVSV